MNPLALTAEMTFSEAAELYMRIRATAGPVRYIKANTERSYLQYIGSLKLFFGETPLRDIRWFDMKKYQEARVTGQVPFIRKRRPHEEPGPCPCKPAKVNQELNFLRSLKQRAQSWTAEDEEFHENLLEIESEIPRALTLDEERRWLRISASQPRWMVVHWYSLLSFHTCMSSNEIRSLRFGNVNLESRILSVPAEGAKNRHRIRTIPLEDADALWAAEQLISRARGLGSVDPQHYLFPFRDIRANHYVPSRPMTVHGIRKQWEEVRDASGLTWFRPYDTRHTAITRLAEAGVPLSIIMDLAGHISPMMSRHYTHISDQAKIKAMQQAQRQRNTDVPPRTYAPAADLSNPLVQAEIARQVALALREKEREEVRYVPVAQQRSSANLVAFPGRR